MALESMKAFGFYGAKLNCARPYISSQLHPPSVYSLKRNKIVYH